MENVGDKGRKEGRGELKHKERKEGMGEWNTRRRKKEGGG